LPCSTYIFEGDFLGFHGWKQGSGPNRGQSPVELGDFPSIHLFISPLWNIQLGLRPSQPGLRPSQPGLNPSQPGLRPSQLSLKPEGGTNGRTDGRTNKQKISPFYRTLSPIGAAALPPPMKTKEKVEQSKGTADHLMPLGYLFSPETETVFDLWMMFRISVSVKNTYKTKR